jgi:hypothetical protein
LCLYLSRLPIVDVARARRTILHEFETGVSLTQAVFSKSWNEL